MKPLTIVVYGLDSPFETRLALKYLRQNSDPSLTHIVLVDNGSTEPYEHWDADQLVRYETNIGGNAVQHRLLQEGQIEKTLLTGFLHADTMVRERGWDARVLKAFQDFRDVALLGFVGSNEIDAYGGRGGGTTLNYIGDFYEGLGQASKAEVHGRRFAGLMPAAVLDHMSMIFRTDKLLQLTPQEGHYAPEHFMDRIWCCEVLEHGWKVAYLGIACDHRSGGIGAGQPKAHALRMRWLEQEGIPVTAAEGEDITKISQDAVYRESERRFLTRFRDSGFIPLMVSPDWKLHHLHHLRGGTWRPRV